MGETFHIFIQALLCVVGFIVAFLIAMVFIALLENREDKKIERRKYNKVLKERHSDLNTVLLFDDGSLYRRYDFLDIKQSIKEDMLVFDYSEVENDRGEPKAFFAPDAELTPQVKAMFQAVPSPFLPESKTDQLSELIASGHAEYQHQANQEELRKWEDYYIEHNQQTNRIKTAASNVRGLEDTSSKLKRDAEVSQANLDELETQMQVLIASDSSDESAGDSYVNADIY